MMIASPAPPRPAALSLQLDGRRGLFMTELSYASALVSWIYFRLIKYPFPVLYACFIVPIKM